MNSLDPRVVDLVVFAVQLCLVAAFLFVLKKGLGIRLSIADFVAEFRELLGMRPSAKALNALGMIVLGLLAIIPLVGTVMSPWRQAAYSLLAITPEVSPAVPTLSVLGFGLVCVLVFGLGSIVACNIGSHRRPRPVVRLASRR